MIGGLILAGGLSSRMGRDKALLPIEGGTLLDRTARVLRRAGAELVAVSGSRPGGIPDRYEQAGPLAGLASSAPFLPDGEWLVVPVDMPCLQADALVPLLSGHAQASRWTGHPLPMRLRLDDGVRALLDRLMVATEGRRSLFALQAELDTADLPLDALDTRWLVNCNTPDEWHEANP